MAKNKLPEKLSALILAALKDLQRVRRRKNVAVDMGTWHESLSTGGCIVCFGGAVMAGTLKVPDSHMAYPEHFADHTRDRLCALNYLRRGELGDALSVVGAKRPVDFYGAPDVAPVFGEGLSSAGRSARFYREMRAVAAWLKERGL